MNKAMLIGRITQLPTNWQTQKGELYCRATVAIKREFSKNDESDFIDLTIFGKNAEYVSKYVGRGDLVCIEGTISSTSKKNDKGEFEKNFGVVVNNISHLESREIVSRRREQQTTPPNTNTNGNEPWEI